MIHVIAAVGRDRAIGAGGDLVCHIGADLRRFKELTMGHPVVMGRKTWESLPRRPLPGRLNVVVSRDASYVAQGAVVCRSLEEGLQRALQSDDDVFVIGGGSIYAQAMDKARVIHLTEVDAEFEHADTFFPQLAEGVWRQAAAGDWIMDGASGLTYRFSRWVCSGR